MISQLSPDSYYSLIFCPLIPHFELYIHYSDFYLCVLHPVAHLSNRFLMMPSIAKKFQYVKKASTDHSSDHHYAVRPADHKN
jgi:hypothetical protein